MAREKEAFRDNLELLNDAFPDKNLLTIADVVKWTGFKRVKVEKLFGHRFIGEKHETKFISKADLARAVSSSGGR